MGQRVNKLSKLKLISGGLVNASFNNTHIQKLSRKFVKKKLCFFSHHFISFFIKFNLFDPKPGDLALSRLKKR
jgi:hypothetical protein